MNLLRAHYKKSPIHSPVSASHPSSRLAPRKKRKPNSCYCSSCSGPGRVLISDRKRVSGAATSCLCATSHHASQDFLLCGVVRFPDIPLSLLQLTGHNQADTNAKVRKHYFVKIFKCDIWGRSHNCLMETLRVRHLGEPGAFGATGN